MTARRQWAVVGAVVLVLAAGLVAVTRLLGDELFPVTVGSRAPNFRAVTLDPEPRARTLGDYRGRVVLLNVWATWCPPCKAEMPSMQALHEEFGGRGLAVVAVSVDEPGAAEEIRRFAREHRLTFEILHDAAGTIQRQYQTTGVPETFVVGPDGVIRRKVVGAADWSSAANRAHVRSLLAEPAGAAAPR